MAKWNVQQAHPIDKYPLMNGEEFWLTQKLNGVRATYYNGVMMARSGAEFAGLDHITAELAEYDGLVFDGELTLKNKEGLSDNEAFRTATGIIQSKSEHKAEICFTIFDVIPTCDFEGSTPCITYSERREKMDELMGVFEKSENISVLPVLYHGADQSKIDELLDRMVREDKEGLILNKDVPYKRTRHSGILKIKRFYTMDLRIIGCEEGTGRFEGTLGALVVDYKGNEVRVGTGFTEEGREDLWFGADELIGKLCEVKYKEISYDKKTKLESLQFPVFVGLRMDKTDVSFA